MIGEKTVAEAAAFAENMFREEYSGHDVFHTMRVFRTATALAEAEGADLYTVQLAALLHDVDDRKLSPETCETRQHAVDFLKDRGCDGEEIRRIVRIIDDVSFRGTDSKRPDTVEGACVQDADRLDAIGAVGIARAFAYGGHHNRIMYDPDNKPRPDMNGEEYYASRSTTLNHFYEKLFLLKDMMNTETAKKMAEERDRFMREYVREFLAEWNGEA